MKRIALELSLLALSAAAIAAAETGASIPDPAPGPATPPAATQAKDSLQEKVRHELALLPYYGVFDELNFNIDGSGTVTLSGFVTRPTLKADAAAVVKRVNGVSRVENQIVVLPLSPMDDRIRLATWRAIYGYVGFDRYALQPVGPIHIIVSNGNVTLAGRVANKADRNIANIRANGVQGVFKVTNELEVDRP